MFEFLKILLGSAQDQQRAATTLSSQDRSRDGTGGDVLNRYFELSMRIETAKADRDYSAAIAASRETYPLLATVVSAMKREYGRFDIATSHAVHTGGTLMAVMGDMVGLRELRHALEAVPELRDWILAADEADRDAQLVASILDAVAASPGILQSELKTHITILDGRRASRLAEWLEKAGRIRRVRTGKTYKLFSPSAGSAATSPTSPPRPGDQQASLPTPSQRRAAKRPRVIDLGSLAFVRLPQAPAVWQEHDRPSSDPRGIPRGPDAEPFEVDAPRWTLAAIERLAPEERPDPAFREAYRTGTWTYWLDPKGHRDGHPDAAAVLQVTGPTGALEVERGLSRDVYRADVNADGSAIIFMSRDGVLHAYDHRLSLLLEQHVAVLPEYAACANRLGIEPRELKNHVRCVAVSQDATRYLLTVVDEAWCMSLAGDVQWGLRMPTQEGWTRVASPRSERSGTSSQIDEALTLMGLSYPVTANSVTQQYRRLAMQWHPDRNPGDSSAVQRMQQLNAAMELLTGVDLSNIQASTLERVTYEKILGRSSVDIGYGAQMHITVSLGASEKSAADWIYAANFAWRDNRVFLASYGGKVIEVSSDGVPVRVFDIGAVPRQIVDTGTHLYLLTDTRLYVLAGEALEALVDVYDKGELIVGETGFGLLASKAFSWYSPTGQFAGTIRARDPIRRTLSTAEALLVETRQHRARIQGAPCWWRERDAPPS